jgi:phytoene desaturase
MGVEIRLGEAVEGLLYNGRRAVGVRTPSGEHVADAVVINGDFADAMTRLVPDGLRRRWTNRKIATKRFSCSTFMMYLGIEGSYPDLAHHTIWLADNYQENLRDIEERQCPPENPSFYVQNPGRTDPTLAPEGHSTLYCLAPVPHQCDVDWSREMPRYRRLFLRQMEKIGLKDVEKRIRFERIITPRDWEHKYGIYRGATFNLAHNLGQMLHRRPHNRFEDLDGVYLVGGGTHPGSGLPVIFESARISARLLLQDLKVPIRWPGQTGEAARHCETSVSVPITAGATAIPDTVH